MLLECGEVLNHPAPSRSSRITVWAESAPRPIRVNKIKTNAFDTSKLFDQGRVKKIGVKINEIKVINERCVAELLPPNIAIVNLITF